MIRPIGVATSAVRSPILARAPSRPSSRRTSNWPVPLSTVVRPRHPVGIVVHRDDAAGAGLVLHHDGRLALDMAGKAVSDHAGEQVAAAAGRKPNQHLELLALKERCLRRGRACDKRGSSAAAMVRKSTNMAGCSYSAATRTPRASCSGEDRQADEQDFHPFSDAKRQILPAGEGRVLAQRLPVRRSLAT